MSILLSILTQGLIYSLMALGVYITYSILDFPDLSVDSTFPFGAAVTAAAIVAGVPAPLTLPLSFAAGALARHGHRPHPCEAENQGSPLRHHRDDRTLFH